VTVHSSEYGRLRRAMRSGDPEAVLGAVEAVLGDPDPALYDEAAEAFYDIFWVAAEDEDLDEQLGRLDFLLRTKGLDGTA